MELGDSINGNQRTVGENQPPFQQVDSFECAGHRHISAAVFLLIRKKIGDDYRGLILEIGL